MRNKDALNKSFGFGLIDFLVALALGAALLWQVAVLYKDMHQTHAIQEDLSQLLMHGQWFQDYFSYEIKTAGMVACLPKSTQAQAKREAVMAYAATNVPTQWGSATSGTGTGIGGMPFANPIRSISQFETAAFF